MPLIDQDRAIARDMQALFAGVALTRGGRSNGALVVKTGGSDRRRNVGGWLFATGPLVIGLLAVGFYARQSDAISGAHLAPDVTRPIATVAAAPVVRAKKELSGRLEVEDARSKAEPIAAASSSSPRLIPALDRKHALPVAGPIRAVSATATEESAHAFTAAQPRPEVEDNRPAGVSASVQGCRLGDDTDDCIFAEVVGADHRLRSAYDAAAGAGVSPRLLAAIGRRWQQARSLSDDNPDETIRRYRSLARELDDLATQLQ